MNGDGMTNAECQAQAFISASDYRLKKDITPVQNFEPYLEKVRNVESITYRYKTESQSSTPHIGFTAQSLPEGVRAELVSSKKTNAAPEYYGVNLSDLSGLLLNSVKALDENQQTLESIIIAQQKTIAEQQQLIEVLAKRIDSLEKK